MTLSMTPICEYREALGRLVKNKPVRVPKGIRITNDAVALEAGRGKGSIKKSRVAFLLLIEEIDAARALQMEGSIEEQHKAQLEKTKGLSNDYRDDLDVAVEAMLCYVHQIHRLQREVSRLEGVVEDLTVRLSVQAKVKPLRPGKT